MTPVLRLQGSTSLPAFSTGCAYRDLFFEQDITLNLTLKGCINTPVIGVPHPPKGRYAAEAEKGAA